MKRLKNFLIKLHRDEQGAMAVEKILLLALIALPLIIALIAFRKTILEWFTGKAKDLGKD